jgi:O-methyltransferase involved in polyketide biosynthesis
MADSELPPRLSGAETPNPARIYDYLLGGQNNHAADREVADALLAAAPATRATAVENRRFLGRAVRYAAGEGVRQFLDIGAGLPTQDNVHQIAARAANGSRVVYVDSDPAVVEHAQALVASDDNVAVVAGDLRQPEQILAHPVVRRLLDFTEPIALLLVGVLYFVPDDEDPYAAMARLRDALAPGSYVVISHATGDTAAPADTAKGTKIYRQASAGLTLRSRAQIERFLTGLDLVEPGLVLLSQWRPSGSAVHDHTLDGAAGYGAVGRVRAR